MASAVTPPPKRSGREKLRQDYGIQRIYRIHLGSLENPVILSNITLKLNGGFGLLLSGGGCLFRHYLFKTDELASGLKSTEEPEQNHSVGDHADHVLEGERQ